MTRISAQCPACQTEMDIQRYRCPRCDTAIEGRFDRCGFCALSVEQMEFVMTFLTSRGNIKEVERELGISYPTVRARLEGVLSALGVAARESAEKKADHSDVLDRIESGELSASDALAILKQRGG